MSNEEVTTSDSVDLITSVTQNIDGTIEATLNELINTLTGRHVEYIVDDNVRRGAETALKEYVSKRISVLATERLTKDSN